MYEVKNELSFRTVPLAHYTYAGDTHAAHLSSTLLYTLTKTGKEKRSGESNEEGNLLLMRDSVVVGLEIWTLRPASHG